MYKTIVPLTLAMALSMPSLADEASVKKAVEGKLGGAVTSVTKTPYLGLYEVFVDGQIVYTDEKVSALLLGALIDGKTMKNVTDGRMQKLTAIKFADLPLALAVKQVRGDGKRVLATFEDPNCGYCKKMRMDLVAMKDITIYTFPIPILAADSEVKSRKALCADDKVKAWNDMMISGKVPSNPGTCDNALGKLRELAQKLGVSATPTAFFQNGKRLQGYVPGPQFDKMLDENTKS